MAKRVDVLQTFIKTTAVSGIALVWVNFTVKAFKMAWHIISTSPEDENWRAVSKEMVMCDECQGYFFDDGGELIHGKLLCESFCSDDLVRDELELKKYFFQYIKHV